MAILIMGTAFLRDELNGDINLANERFNEL
ncbi:hypothetical protein SAMN04487928_12845 [Butyrivibrio proteoclasticus]|uniref:Uncharacterized protein n=1 Tax=Butyrivibrio proteoclasticus TaxID=43305 RepID=A0A1I5X6F3_9FIRM|nr:hypothetical protein SAMN04487928_12845 [Butyrivibrio proteoclasticus]